MPRTPVLEADVTGAVADHTEAEDKPWKVWVDGHPQRSDSKEFKTAKKVAKKILASSNGQGVLAPDFFTEDPLPQANMQIQMHHGGSIWLYDENGWFIVKNLAGIEWSSQFCADPAKVEVLRQTVVRLIARFPDTITKLKELGYDDIETVVNTPITTADDVARWTDSIFNACVPLPAVRHTGVLPGGDGVHHYPTPITDIDLIKRADFQLFVVDPEEHQEVAVVPRGVRGSGIGSVSVIHAEPGTRLHAAKANAKARGEDLVLPSDHPIAKAAFELQNREDAGTHN
jgi:hypothetical protein